MYTARESDENKARKYLLARANLFLLMGILLVNMIVFMGDSISPETIVFLIIVVGMLFGGAILMYIAVYLDSGNRTNDDLNKAYVCKYCGEKFKNERLKKRHERCCPKMKI